MEPDPRIPRMLVNEFATNNITTMAPNNYTPNIPTVYATRLTQNIHPPLVLDPMDNSDTFANTIPNGAQIYDNPSAIPSSEESPQLTSKMDANLLLSKDTEIADLKERIGLLEHERDFYKQQYRELKQQYHHLPEPSSESPRLAISPPNISPCEFLHNAPKRRSSGNTSDGNTSPKQVTRRKLETNRMIEPRNRGRLESFNSFNTSRPSRYSYDTFTNSIGSSFDAALIVDNDEKYTSEFGETYNDNVNNEKGPEERS